MRDGVRARVRGLPNIREGRNWEIPNVILGDSLISDVDRAVMSVHRRLGRKYHLVGSRLGHPVRTRGLRARRHRDHAQRETATSGIRNSA